MDLIAITGAGGALGSELARLLASRGKRVALLGSERQREHLAKLAPELGGVAVTGDFATEAAWARALEDMGAVPTAAALVAGGWEGGAPLHEADDAVWSRMFHANADTVYRGLRALLPGMVAAQRGSIVVVGSRAALQPASSANAAAYAASKAAAVALVQAVAAEVKARGVRVNAVLPGTLDTPANRVAMPNADTSAWVPLAAAASTIASLLGGDTRDVTGAALPL